MRGCLANAGAWRRGVAALALLLALALPGCSSLKPLRGLAPERYGLTCASGDVCVEDPSRLGAARDLRDAALRFVETGLGPLEAPSRALFCSSAACAQAFGSAEVSALYVWGTATILVNKR